MGTRRAVGEGHGSRDLSTFQVPQILKVTQTPLQRDTQVATSLQILGQVRMVGGGRLAKQMFE